LASPYRLRRGVLRHKHGAGCSTVGSLLAGGRRCGRWCGLRWCSMSWAWLLVEVWVVALPARGRRRCRVCVPQECSMSWAWLLAEVWVVLVAAAVADGVCFVGVRGCGRGCWPWCGLSRWSWPLLMGLAFP